MNKDYWKNRALIVRRECLLSLRYYRWGRGMVTPRNIYMSDGHLRQGGFFDRLKGMCSLYALSKVQGVPFKINFTEPFSLTDYLQPNHYDWRCDEPVEYKFPATRPLVANPAACARLFVPPKRERHIYLGYDLLPKIAEDYGESYSFGALYRELFRPSDWLEAEVGKHLSDLGHYLSVHIRAVNRLGDATEKSPAFPRLPEAEAGRVMARIASVLGELLRDAGGRRVLVSTDSNILSAYLCENLPDIYFVRGEIRHIGNAGSLSDAAVKKMFVDYHLLAAADECYSLVGSGLYHSEFPLYAAQIGGIPFSRKQIIYG